MTWSRHSPVLIAVSSCAILACRGGAPQPVVAAPPPGAQSAAPALDTISEFNRREVARILEQIAGREMQRADSVFKNVTQLGATPARTLLLVMNVGYARALGVRCTYCHVENDFASDDKRPKRAAREMAVMHRMINMELRKMEHIATPPTQNRAINCSTCHRGVINPMAPLR